MSTTQQPEALRLADALAYCDASVASQAAAELRRLHAENTTLQAGYAAARLEIESLRAAQPAIAMLGEQAELRHLSACCPELNLSNYGPDDVDELNGWAIEVSQCIDRALAPQPAGAQQPGTAYAALERLEHANDALCKLRTDEQYLSMINSGQQEALAELDAARNAARAILRASHGQACPNIDDLCTKIKAADDAAADRDYMLDSNDCIAVLRGEWKGPLAMDKPERASHGQTPDTKTPILQWIMKTAERAKEPCGDDPESPAAVRNSALASIAGAAAQALGLVSGPHYWQAPVTDAERTALILALRALQHCSPNLTSDRAWQPDGWREQRAEAISACAEVLASQAAATTTEPAPQLPERDASVPAEQQGLFRKFDVRRVDGGDLPGGKHYGCRYFVIDVDHDQNAHDTLTAYAAACELSHPELAADLRSKWGADCAPQQEAQEPVAWQSRTRPTWGGDNRPWSPWEPCTKGRAEDCWKTPLLHAWAYEARALYAAPQPSPASQGDALTQAARDVLAERQRQISAEGYDADHDDAHVNDEIAAMAALFVMPPGAREWDASSTSYGDTLAEAILPQDWEMPALGDRRRELVRGAAMALAELERIDRAAQKGGM